MPDQDDGQDHHVCAYSYALRGDLPRIAIEELQRAHNLRNSLVAIEREHEQRVADVWAANQDLSAALARVALAEEQLTELEELGATARSKAKSTDIGSDLRTAVKAARKERREARAELREQKAKHYAGMKDQFDEINRQRQAEVKALYRKYIDEGLYWATYNDVLNSHKAAVKRVAARRAEGLPAELKFQRWTGEGTLCVQLQRGAEDPPRTPETIANAKRGPWRNVFAMRPLIDPVEHAKLDRGDQRRAGHGYIRFRIGSGDAKGWVKIDTTIHRPLPLDADIALARITRRRVAGSYRCELSVTFRLPTVPKRTEGPSYAAHIGWRALADGALRIATIATTAGNLPPTPPDLHESIRHHGDWAELVLPAHLRSNRFPRVRGIRSTRDKALDIIRAELVEWLTAHPIEGLEHVARWRSPARFAVLARQWTDDPPDDGADIAAKLEAWRKQDRHLWEWQTHETDRVLRYRREIYRLTSAWITDTAGAVIIDEWTIDARRPTVEQVDDPQQQAARSNRVLAAPGRFRETLQDAARARGVTVIPTSPLSRTHSVCGSHFDDADRRENIMVWCPTCQVLVDQDADAVRKLLGSATRPTQPS